jgi:hypothetical protein
MLIPLSLSQKRYNLLQLPILICHILWNRTDITHRPLLTIQNILHPLRDLINISKLFSLSFYNLASIDIVLDMQFLDF